MTPSDLFALEEEKDKFNAIADNPKIDVFKRFEAEIIAITLRNYINNIRCGLVTENISNNVLHTSQ